MDGWTYTGGPGECSSCWPHKIHVGPCKDFWVDEKGNKTHDCECVTNLKENND